MELKPIKWIKNYVASAYLTNSTLSFLYPFMPAIDEPPDFMVIRQINVSCDTITISQSLSYNITAQNLSPYSIANFMIPANVGPNIILTANSNPQTLIKIEGSPSTNINFVLSPVNTYSGSNVPNMNVSICFDFIKLK